MKHPQKFYVIGFCDASWKWSGIWQNTYFPEDKCFVSPHIPTREEIKAYAESLGYTPGVGFKHSMEKIRAIYKATDERLDYINCETCFPYREVIDNLGVRE